MSWPLLPSIRTSSLSDLRKRGLLREQAAAIAEAQSQSLSEALDSTLATKGDIRELRADMLAIELRITLRLGGLMAAIVSIAVLKMHP